MSQLSNFSPQAYQNVLLKNGSGETYAFEFKARNILGRKPAETSKGPYIKDVRRIFGFLDPSLPLSKFLIFL